MLHNRLHSPPTPPATEPLALTGRLHSTTTTVEIAARATDQPVQERRAQRLAEAEPTISRIVECHFDTPGGSLILRNVNGSSAEMVHIRRFGSGRPTVATHSRAAIPAVGSVSRVLGAALGERGRVEISRRSYRIDRAEVHFDEVANLGPFIAMHIAVGPEDELAASELRTLVEALDICPEDLVSATYLELQRS